MALLLHRVTSLECGPDLNSGGEDPCAPTCLLSCFYWCCWVARPALPAALSRPWPIAATSPSRRRWWPRPWRRGAQLARDASRPSAPMRAARGILLSAETSRRHHGRLHVASGQHDVIAGQLLIRSIDDVWSRPRASVSLARLELAELLYERDASLIRQNSIPQTQLDQIPRRSAQRRGGTRGNRRGVLQNKRITSHPSPDVSAFCRCASATTSRRARPWSRCRTCRAIWKWIFPCRIATHH
jgi:hypothetical protein